jgi:hypothetical protein
MAGAATQKVRTCHCEGRRSAHKLSDAIPDIDSSGDRFPVAALSTGSRSQKALTPGDDSPLVGAPLLGHKRRGAIPNDVGSDGISSNLATRQTYPLG